MFHTKNKTMDKKNHNTTGRTERLVEKSPMVVNVRREIIDVLRITNRRFMYDPQTGRSSHAQEFHDSQAGGRFDDYLRGWVGISRRYPRGIVHFAPAVSMEQFDRGFDTLLMFARLEGINGDTVVRGFCTLPETKLSGILPATLKEGT